MKIKEEINPVWGKAFGRISKAFHTNFDKVEWVEEGEDIELVHIVGGKEAEYLLYRKDLSNIIVVQHCFKTAGVYSQALWDTIWKNSKLVISFHNLPRFTETKFNFLRTPWGADPNIFIQSHEPKLAKVFATGHVAETESLDKIFDACLLTNTHMIHTGENFKWNSKFYDFREYMDDVGYVNVLSRVEYVAGLRAIEGFEMACIEGAMVGATPIVPMEDSYDFYEPFAIRVDTKNDIVNQLVNIFKEKYTPLSQEKIDYVRSNFDWKVVCSKIQDAILES